MVSKPGNGHYWARSKSQAKSLYKAAMTIVLKIVQKYIELNEAFLLDASYLHLMIYPQTNKL